VFCLLLATLAAARPAAAIPPTVTPVAAPVDVAAEYQAWLRESGRPPAELACDVLWPAEALLCFKTVEGTRRRWVTTADLARWDVDLPGLRAEITRRASEEVVLERVQVTGMDAWYWVSTRQDGWAAAGVLHPDRLVSEVGGEAVLVALPVDGVLLAWKPGDAELDRVVAVAVHELYTEQQGPISSVVFRWDGTRWAPFAEAVPEGP